MLNIKFYNKYLIKINFVLLWIHKGRGSRKAWEILLSPDLDNASGGRPYQYFI